MFSMEYAKHARRTVHTSGNDKTNILPDKLVWKNSYGGQNQQSELIAFDWRHTYNKGHNYKYLKSVW